MSYPTYTDKFLRFLFSRVSWLSYSKKESILSFFRRPGTGFEFTHSIEGVVLSDLNTSSWVEQKIYYYGAYEKYLLKIIVDISTVLKDSCESWSFWDVGANIGQYSLALLPYADCVVAVEPFPPLAKRLLELANKYEIKNMRVLPVGLGSVDSTLPFKSPALQNQGVGTFVQVDNHDLMLPVKKADSILSDSAALDMPPIKLMKIDVEGAEAEVLSGMQNLLQTNKPLVVLECTPNLRDSAPLSLKSILSLFPQGYSFYEIEFTGYLDRSRFHVVSLETPWTKTVELLCLPAWAHELVRIKVI